MGPVRRKSLVPALAALLALAGPHPQAQAQPRDAARAAGTAAVRAVLPAQKLPSLPALPAALAPLPLPPTVNKDRLQALLQAFVNKAYGKAFRHLGEERDFDHGHFLFASDAPSAAPVAILYHTQELAYYAAPGSGYSWINPEARNWIQWLDDGRIENAKDLERADTPADLPVSPEELRSHHTILAQMLEPARFGAAGLRALRSRQIVFTRAVCSGAQQLRIRLPGAADAVCLSLSEY